MNTIKFQKDLVTGSYDLITLDVLSEGPAYVYAMIRKIAEQSRNRFQWNEGTAYRVLHHLEGQQLVASEWRGPRLGRRRKYYRLTGQGRRAWKQRRAQWREFSDSMNSLLGF